MKNWLVSALLIAAAWFSGCDRPAEPAARAATLSGEPAEAQPRLKTIKVWLGSEELNTEVALTARQIQTGMMFRTNMAENEAMLFVFAVPHRASFWMKNTLVPLSAAYINSDGTILEIHDLHPKDTNSVTASSDRVQYVLETRQGWFSRHNVREGAVIRTERGTLRETFGK